MRRAFCVIAAAGLALVGCTEATPSRTEQVDDRYTLSGASWGDAGEIILAARAYDAGGVVGLCAAVTVSKRQNSRLESSLQSRALGASTVELGDERLVRGLRQFPRQFASQPRPGDPAGCIVTDVPWSPELRLVQPRYGLAQRQVTVRG